MKAEIKWVSKTALSVRCQRNGHYKGVLTNAGKVVWTCSHKHKDGLNASGCSDKELKRRGL